MVPVASGGGHYVIISFAARWSSGEPVLNDEHDDFRWMVPESLDDLEVTDGLPEIIAAARRVLLA